MRLTRSDGVILMRADEIMKLKVMDVASGNTIGSITGILTDGDKKQVVSLEIGG